jgi:hypothetical protein
MFRGLFAADGYQLVYPLRYHELFELLIKPHLDRDPERRRYFENWGQRAYAWAPEFNRDLASLMGVRWLVVRGMPFADPRWRLVFADGEERVFENPDVLPRSFVAAREERYPSRSALRTALGSAPLEELRETAFVENGAPAVGGGVGGEDAPRGVARATPILDTPDRLSFAVEASGPAVLVLTDALVPGWKAWVNGGAAPIFPVDDAFRGVAVPPGRSEVSFRYVPEWTRAGFAIAAAAGGALLLLSAAAVRRAPRPHAHAPAGGA